VANISISLKLHEPALRSSRCMIAAKGSGLGAVAIVRDASARTAAE